MGFLFSKPSYDPARDIPDLSGKVCVVTGANSGLGFETSLQLAKKGAKVYLGCRSEGKAQDAIARIRTACGPELHQSLEDRLVWLPLDLSVVKLAKMAADEFLRKETRLDILVNNAAHGLTEFQTTEDGLEASIATNHLGHFVFTVTLLPVLRSTAKLPGTDVRVLTLCSLNYMTPGLTDFSSFEVPESLQGTGLRNKFCRYGTSKLMNILFIKELQRRLDAENITITAVSLHPGAVVTEGSNQYSPTWLKILTYPMWVPVYQGAYPILFAATSARVAAEREKFKGGFLEPVGKLAVPKTAAARDADSARVLWETSERVAKEVLAGSGEEFSAAV